VYGVLLKVWIGQPRTGLAATLYPLLPTDEPVVVVVKDENGKRDAKAFGGFKFLRIHEKPAVAHGRHDASLGILERSRDRTWQGKPHTGKAVRDETTVRTLDWKISRDPNLVAADITEQKIVLPHNRVQDVEDSRDGERLAFLQIVAGDVSKDPLTNRRIPCRIEVVAAQSCIDLS
jgi:hypothetical protein